MTLTIGAWVFIGIIFVIFLSMGIGFTYDSGEFKHLIIWIVVGIVVCALLVFVFSWYYTNTAKGARSYKDYESNINNGLYREITITAEDGREIFHYEGKVDIETKHDGNGNYILFESEEGYRYIIYYGIQDTVLIIEKANE